MESRTKVLIVDDQPGNLKVLVDLIAGFNGQYEVLQTVNPKAALEICKKELPEVVITDWEMPDMNGIELIRSLKQSPETTDIPIIMCTGIMTSSENLRQAIEAGAVDYIRKPIDEIELQARLGSMVKLYRASQKIKEQVEQLAIEKARREEFLVSKLELKDQDISELAMMLAHKQNMAEQVLDKIKVIRSKGDGGSGLRELALDLQIQLQSDKVDKTFHENIDAINSEFFNTLTKRFPALSKGEKELCGMIRIDLSTKEIAGLKNIDPASVKKSRQRLRKKLDLDPADDLYVFLKSL